MHKFSVFFLATLLAASAAWAQFSPGKIVGGVQQGAADHEQQLDEVMNGNKPPMETPNAIKNGWMERTMGDGTVVRLYVQHPAIEANNAAPNLPAVVVVHEMWGVNDEMEKRAESFGAKGYYAVAVDLFDGKMTKDATEAAGLVKGVSDPAAQKRIKAGVDFVSDLAAKGIVDKAHVGIIGFDIGGRAALMAAIADPRIKATAIFYGGVVTDAGQLKKLQGPVLGIFGNDDTAPNSSDIDALEKSLRQLNITKEIHRYEGAGHFFATKSGGMYKETQAKDAWDKTWAWLDATLKPAK